MAEEVELLQLAEADYYGDYPLVLTATRLKQSQANVPVATTIIDRDMIEASGFTEIPDLMRLAPGMLVNYDSGHIAGVGYQFLFDRYTIRYQVLVDGRSVYTPLFGEMPWTQLGLSVDDIERIEVIRGPSSASYGPNAMLGVISIITRDAVFDTGVKFKVNQGVNGRSEKFFTVGDGVGGFNYKLSVASRKDDGFKRRYDGKDLRIANFRSDWQASNNDVLSFFLGYNSGEYQEDSTETLNDSMPDHLKNVIQQSQQIKWTHNFSNSTAFILNYYQQDYDDKNKYLGDFTDDGLGFVTVDESVSTRRNNIELTLSKYTDAYSITLGALYRKDNTLAPEFLFNVDKDIYTRQLFVNSVLHFNKRNAVNVDVLYDDNSTGGRSVSPRIALNHRINENHMLRVSYAASTRSPFSLEEYANRVVYVPVLSDTVDVWTDKGDLGPEKIKSVDVGYIAVLNDGETVLDVRAYESRLTDLIVHDWRIGGGFIQGDAFSVRGVELRLSQQLKQSKIILNYARTKIRAGDLVYYDAGWFETGAPQDNASLLVMHDFGAKINGSFGYYYTGTYQQFCCEVDLQAPRKRLDLVLSRKLVLGEYDVKLKLVLQNISNEKVETRLFNNYDRQGYLSLAVEM